MSIKASINLKLLSNLMNVLSGIIRPIIPKMDDRKILNYNLLAVSSDAKGCFFL